MLHHLRFVLHQVAHDLRVGLLLRPALLTGSLAAAAVGLTVAERDSPSFAALLGRLPLFHGEPATAQLVLASIAGSMMTVVSVVYSVLIMALCLASLQFSPRIMSTFMRDRTSQTTLGLFIGTFAYCLLVLPGVRLDPAFVPTLSVSLGMVMALVSLGWLVYFIHHIAQMIQANHIVERIASDTELVIDDVFRLARAEGDHEDDEPLPAPAGPGARVRAPSSGYVQLIDEDGLALLAAEHGLELRADRGVGDYAPEGGALLTLWPARLVTAGVGEACVEAFDLGPVRTMQQDAGFGLRQIVDIALKAISPAVNDPSTAATCIDHLGRLLCRIARRRLPPLAPGLRIPRLSFVGALDLAFNQIRQYGRADMAVSLRVVRALTEIAGATAVPAHLRRVRHHARLVGSASTGFQEEDGAALRAGLAELEALLDEQLGAPSAAPGP